MRLLILYSTILFGEKRGDEKRLWRRKRLGEGGEKRLDKINKMLILLSATKMNEVTCDAIKQNESELANIHF